MCILASLHVHTSWLIMLYSASLGNLEHTVYANLLQLLACNLKSCVHTKHYMILTTPGL